MPQDSEKEQRADQAYSKCAFLSAQAHPDESVHALRLRHVDATHQPELSVRPECR